MVSALCLLELTQAFSLLGGDLPTSTPYSQANTHKMEMSAYQ